MSADTAGLAAASDGGMQAQEPVFVLCGGRFGSTLLRLVLDAHPDIACPPETNLPNLCGQLAIVWSLITGTPLPPGRSEEPPVIPEAAIAGTRQVMDLLIGSYLARRGKARYCDKSLGTAQFAELLLRVYPGAKFLCLYRHPMDVVASGIEACPWGLTGYGFDQYVAASPGNQLLALARYWADNTASILAAEEQFPGACLRVRYEDLVTAPEQTAERVFGFLGVPHVPGLTASCVSASSERFGPGDFKIWYTSGIDVGSVGRGWHLPAGQIPPPVLEHVNALAGRLGYLPVDEQWGGGPAPTDLRAGSADTPAPESADVDATGGREGLATAVRLGERLKTGLERLGSEAGQNQAAILSVPFGIAVTDVTGGQAAWRVDVPSGAVTEQVGLDDADTEWDVLGSSLAWDEVLSGQVNVGLAMRRYRLRYLDTGEAGPAAVQERVGLMANLLGLMPGAAAPQAAEKSP